jgi:hypothetical protein
MRDGRVAEESQSSGLSGQVIQRFDDGGATWEPMGNQFAYHGTPGTHQWYDGTPHPWEFARVWHLEPSLEDPDTVWAGVEDAGLFRSEDGAQSWQELPALRGHDTGSSWQPGAGGMCLHTILLDPSAPGRMFAAISAAGAFRSDDAGQSWRPINRGLQSEGIPDPDAEVGHCVHRIAMHPSRPQVLFMHKHWDVMRSDDGGKSWHEISGNLPTDFGFPIDVHAHEPETIYMVPITSDAEHYPPGSGPPRLPARRTGYPGPDRPRRRSLPAARGRDDRLDEIPLAAAEDVAQGGRRGLAQPLRDAGDQPVDLLPDLSIRFRASCPTVVYAAVVAAHEWPA